MAGRGIIDRALRLGEGRKLKDFESAVARINEIEPEMELNSEQRDTVRNSLISVRRDQEEVIRLVKPQLRQLLTGIASLQAQASLAGPTEARIEPSPVVTGPLAKADALLSARLAPWVELSARQAPAGAEEEEAAPPVARAPRVDNDLLLPARANLQLQAAAQPRAALPAAAANCERCRHS